MRAGVMVNLLVKERIDWCNCLRFLNSSFKNFEEYSQENMFVVRFEKQY